MRHEKRRCSGRAKPPGKRNAAMKNQTFGIEIEMTGITREKAARVIAAHFATQAGHTGGTYDAWEAPDHLSRTAARKWKIVRDRSIEASSDEEQIELVSPICQWDDIETIQELVRALRKAGAKTHPSCGIHVHIGRGEHTPKTLRNLANIINAKEDLLTEALRISHNRRIRWCRETDRAFIDRLNRRKPKTDAAFARLWYNDQNWERHARAHYDDTRYRLLNLHSVFRKGTIEFRAFNSTLHAGEIKSYILLCMAVSHAALTAAGASPRRPITDNPKYTFRCWLLRLGFIGDEFETARRHLVKHLDGNAAWRSPDAPRRAS